MVENQVDAKMAEKKKNSWVVETLRDSFFLWLSDGMFFTGFEEVAGFRVIPEL